MNQKQLGQEAEKLAKKYLQNKGYKFVIQNFRTRYGEIDLIFRHKKHLIFVEVKARRSSAFGIPESAITAVKLEKISLSAQEFMQQNPRLPQAGQIDSIGILFDKNNLPKLSHQKNISL